MQVRIILEHKLTHQMLLLERIKEWFWTEGTQNHKAQLSLNTTHEETLLLFWCNLSFIHALICRYSLMIHFNQEISFQKHIKMFLEWSRQNDPRARSICKCYLHMAHF